VSQEKPSVDVKPAKAAKTSAGAAKASPLLQLLTLSRRARRAEDALSLQFILVNETHTLVPYTVAMLWAQGEGVVAISGVSQVDRNAAFSLWLNRFSKRLFDEQKAAIRIDLAMLTEDDRKEWATGLPANALWIPSAPGALHAFGFLVARDRPWIDEELALLTEWADIWRHAWQKLHAPTLQGEIAKAWGAIRKSIPSFGEISRYAQDVFRGLGRLARSAKLQKEFLAYPFAATGKGLKWLGSQGVSGTARAASGAVKAIWVDKRRRYVWLFWIAVFFPVRLTVLAPAELVPANPAVIRVPIEGVVDEFFVTPNQRVTEGQPLFRLDLTSLSSRLQIAQQEIQIATAELRQSTLQSLTDQKSRRLIAPQEGKAAERRLEADYLRELLEKAQIKAPRDGIALFDDPSEWIGRPVVAGERVMVVATEGEVEIEAWIPISDAIELRDAAPVTLYLNATPLSPVDGELRYMGHEAVQRPDGTYAYRLRASLEEGERARRVGLKGTARVSGSYVPLSYWIFRKPIAWLRQFLGI
jgi:hypothetical protein